MAKAYQTTVLNAFVETDEHSHVDRGVLIVAVFLIVAVLVAKRIGFEMAPLTTMGLLEYVVNIRL